jgi:hypothetical protein
MSRALFLGHLADRVGSDGWPHAREAGESASHHFYAAVTSATYAVYLTLALSSRPGSEARV